MHRIYKLCQEYGFTISTTYDPAEDEFSAVLRLEGEVVEMVSAKTEASCLSKAADLISLKQPPQPGNIGEVLKYVRLRRGYDLTEFAQRVGTTKTALSQRERHPRPSFRALEEWCEALGVKMWEVMACAEGTSRFLMERLAVKVSI